MKTYSILFVDNNPAAMEPYREHLKKKGYEVSERSNVDDALKAIESGRYDLLILDLMMPPGKLEEVVSHQGMDTGKHLYVRARAHDRYLPVIIFTNVDDLVDLAVYEDDPNLDVLRKEDYRPTGLATRIDEILWNPRRTESITHSGDAG
jgi:CheY-like chemotaxis protein